MYEVEKYVFVWKDVPKPENTDRGVWKKSHSGSHRSFMSAEFAKEYKISYTVAYEDESVYKSDKENFDKDFSAGLSSIGYSAEQLSELLKEAEYTCSKTPMTFREWKENKAKQKS